MFEKIIENELFEMKDALSKNEDFYLLLKEIWRNRMKIEIC